ncbi:uncharacterized protein UBRO_20234 [Ustilago bromivora]|uniref:DDE Tnp4 domain-containing protein n=1 Tax=Ustilago bromivora TaxID=307758 RepID=A0A1K0G7Z8_9BASI|nr:uncharacterized protein UBRO_20234 [Ustilago bromivora]
MPQHQTLLDMLDQYLTISCKRFRGLVHMTPEAFEALVLRLSTTVAFQHITNSHKVRQQVAVGLYSLGHSGNGGGVCDIAFACGCSWGSVDAWSRRMVDGLYELNQEVVTFAMEDERANALAWVVEKSGVEEWGQGWLVADDKGKFVWVDAGFGFSAFSVGPFNNNAASKSRDTQYFNYFLSHIQVHAHGIAYLKNHFQCLMGYRGNLYHEEDHERAAYTIQACIVAHTFASQYDHPDDMANYLLQSFSEEDIADVRSGLPLYHQATKEARIMQRDNQA